jgi:8-oxo-dGTP pyrophosphatase MutT (NUDIX family)
MKITQDLKESIFVIIFCKDSVPWKDYNQNKDCIEKVKNKEIPMFLTITRWDGTFGFPGGTIEKEVSIEENAIRELHEEINFIPNFNDLNKVSSYSTEKSTIHFYSIEVNYQKMLEIQRNAIDAQHFNSEITGLNLIHICDYGNNRGLANFLSNNLIGNMRNDLLEFIFNESLMDESELKKICHDYYHLNQ